MKKLRVAIMGLGTVGGGTFQILTEHKEALKKREGLDVEVVKVLERNVDRAIAKGVSKDIVTTDINAIVEDKSIDVVVEVMGGIEPARSFITACLKSGKNVVTANKELIAKHWSELESVARANKVGIYFEASCVGGVPIIRTLVEGMQANDITGIMGIFNGTTNYILTKMSEEGVTYESALKEAQELGYAEADPTSDVDGYDTLYKLSILASLAFHTSIPINVIYREGISKISAEDIKHGKELGYTVKLLAIAKRNGNTIEARVHPTFVPDTHPLASVRGSFNAVHLHGNFVDDIMLYGRGAGDLPTGSAIVSDIVYCSKLSEPKYSTFDNNNIVADDVEISSDFKSKYYMLISCEHSAGVLSKVAAVLGDNGVSIDSVMQTTKNKAEGFANVMFLTHRTSEAAFSAALDGLNKLPVVNKIKSVIRVI